jgi:cytochrome c oxidase assembly protein subunit 11
MPVIFVVEPTLPEDVNYATMSYTFFEVEGRTGTAG